MSNKVSQPTFESKVKTGSPRFEHNVHAMAELVTQAQ